MPGITQINNTSVPQNAPQAEALNNANAPAQLRGARPSAAAIAGRVVLGIFTLGISEGIRAIVHHARAGEAQAPRVGRQALPQAAPMADELNNALVENLKAGTLSATFQSAISEAAADLRALFGTSLLPEDTPLKNLPFHKELMSEVRTAIYEANHEVTPEGLRALINEKAAPLIGKHTFSEALKQHCASIGYDDTPIISNMPTNILKAHPDFAAALQACHNEQELTAAIEDFRPKMENYVSLRNTMYQAIKTSMNHVVAALAENTGLSEASIRAQLDMKKLQNNFNVHRQSITQKNIRPNDEEIRQSFMALADNFIRAKAELYHSIDALNVSAELKDEWKADVLAQSTLSKGNMISVFHHVGSSINANSLISALKAPAGEFSQREIAGLLYSIGAKVDGMLKDHYGLETWIEMGSEGQDQARSYAMQSMLDANPELNQIFRSQPELTNALRALVDEDCAGGNMNSIQNEQFMVATITVRDMFYGMPDISGKNAKLADTLGKPNMAPTLSQAMDAAIAGIREKFGADSLPEGDTSAALKALNYEKNEYLGTLLSREIRASSSVVTSETLPAMLEKEAHGIAAYGAFRGLLKEMAQGMGLHLDDAQISASAVILTKRHPDLMHLLSAAQNRTAVAALLGELKDAGEVMRVQHDIAHAWNKGLNDIYASLAEKTGLSEAEVKEKLNLVAIGSGGKFAYLRKDLDDLCQKPETGVAAPFPSTAEIQGKYQDIVDAFLAGKHALYDSINGFHLPDDMAAAWKSDILTNPALRHGEFLENCVRIADDMRSAGIEEAIISPSVTDDELMGLFLSLGMQQNDLPQSIFPAGEFSSMGADELSALSTYSRQAFFARNPGLVNAIKAHPERMQALAAKGEQMAYAIQKRMADAPHDSPAMFSLQREYGITILATTILTSFRPME